MDTNPTPYRLKAFEIIDPLLYMNAKFFFKDLKYTLPDLMLLSIHSHKSRMFGYRLPLKVNF